MYTHWTATRNTERAGKTFERQVAAVDMMSSAIVSADINRSTSKQSQSVMLE